MGPARFTRQESGVLLCRFEPIEADLLRLAASQLVDLLAAGAADPEHAASDALFARLLPAAYRNDDEAAAEFRRFTSDTLLERKVENAQILLKTLTDVDDEPGNAAVEGSAEIDEDRLPFIVNLDVPQVQAWLRSLTDLRLTLADRLQISSDGLVHLVGDDASFLGELYDWLGMVQEELVYAIDV